MGGGYLGGIELLPPPMNGGVCVHFRHLFILKKMKQKYGGRMIEKRHLPRRHVTPADAMGGVGEEG